MRSLNKLPRALLVSYFTRRLKSILENKPEAVEYIKNVSAPLQVFPSAANSYPIAHEHFTCIDPIGKHSWLQLPFSTLQPLIPVKTQR